MSQQAAKLVLDEAGVAVAAGLAFGNVKAVMASVDRALAPEDVDLGRKGTRYFLPQVEGPGAAKRLHMFLRWMVRRDVVDLGLWRSARPAELLAPLLATPASAPAPTTHDGCLPGRARR